MKTLKLILFAAVLLMLTTAIVNADSWPEEKDGTFTAAVLCEPEFNIIVPPSEPYTVNLGYFFPGTYQDVDLEDLNKIIKWHLSGPAKMPDNSWINYHVWSENGNFSNTLFGVTAKWIFDYDNFPMPASGDFDHSNVHLNLDGAGNCNDDAYFILKALSIQVSASAPVGSTIVIPITVYVSVSI